MAYFKDNDHVHNRLHKTVLSNYVQLWNLVDIKSIFKLLCRSTTLMKKMIEVVIEVTYFHPEGSWPQFFPYFNHLSFLII